MKNFKNLFVMVMVLVVLMVLAPACKTADVDPVEQDDIQFVSMDVKADQFGGAADVSVNSIVKVKTFATTRVSVTVHFGSKENGVTVDIPSTDGKWVTVSIPTVTYGLYSGTYEIKAEFTLKSNGKVVASPITQVVVY
jgi:hypothetical protein